VLDSEPRLWPGETHPNRRSHNVTLIELDRPLSPSDAVTA